MPRITVGLIDHVLSVVDNARPTALPYDVPGMIGFRGRLFLNTLCSSESVNYLEIGTHRGASLIAAAYGNTGQFCGIDDFSKFTSVNPEVALQRNIARFAPHATYKKDSCWNVAPKLLCETVDVLFCDGPHEESAQGYMLAAYCHVLKHDAIVIVDDWRLGGVRRGTTTMIDALPCIIGGQWERMSEFNGDKLGWWNGWGIFVVEKDEQC